MDITNAAMDSVFHFLKTHKKDMFYFRNRVQEAMMTSTTTSWLGQIQSNYLHEKPDMLIIEFDRVGMDGYYRSTLTLRNKTTLFGNEKTTLSYTGNSDFDEHVFNAILRLSAFLILRNERLEQIHLKDVSKRLFEKLNISEISYDSPSWS